MVSSGSKRRLDGMLEYNVIRYGSRPCRSRQGARRPWLLSSLPSVEATRALSEPLLLLKALYLPGCCPLEPAPFTLLLKEPDYSFYGAFSALLPFNAARSLPLSFACRQRHIHVLFLLGRAKQGA